MQKSKTKQLATRNSQLATNSGVVLLYAVILGTVIITVILSIVTLMVSELRFASRVDDSVRAFYAAESGVEYALRWISDGGTRGPGVDCRDTNGADGAFDTESPIGTPDWDWSSLRVLDKDDPDEGTTINPNAVRIKSQGTSNEAKRSIVIDISPACSLANFDGN